MSVDWNAPEIIARVRRGALKGVGEAIMIVDRKAVSHILDDPKTGRIYRRRGIEHRASAPGEAPASDTGRLVNSRVINVIPDRMAARLSFHTAYAMPLEVGTSRMKARPFARRSLNESQGEIVATITARISEELRT